MQGFGGRQGVTRSGIRTVLHAMVVGAGLSGMEAEELSWRDTVLMDKTLTELARKAMGSEGSYTHTDGSRRSKSDEQVRRWMGLHTTDSLLRQRRLKWWRDICNDREGNKQLLAALLGTLRMEEVRNTQAGTPPWIAMIRRDLSLLVGVLGGREDPDLECARWGNSYLLNTVWARYLTTSKIKKVRSFIQANPNQEE